MLVLAKSIGSIPIKYDKSDKIDFGKFAYSEQRENHESLNHSFLEKKMKIPRESILANIFIHFLLSNSAYHDTSS